MYDKPWMGTDAMVHFADDRIGDQPVRDRELVFFESGDERFTRYDRLVTGEQQNKLVAGSGERDACPGLLPMIKDLTLVPGQRQQGRVQPVGIATAGRSARPFGKVALNHGGPPGSARPQRPLGKPLGDRSA